LISKPNAHRERRGENLLSEKRIRATTTLRPKRKRAEEKWSPLLFRERDGPEFLPLDLKNAQREGTTDNQHFSTFSLDQIREGGPTATDTQPHFLIPTKEALEEEEEKRNFFFSSQKKERKRKRRSFRFRQTEKKEREPQAGKIGTPLGLKAREGEGRAPSKEEERKGKREKRGKIVPGVCDKREWWQLGFCQEPPRYICVLRPQGGANRKTNPP